MNIEKLEIKGFGKLADVNLSFSNGFNFIYGENESGKSTLQAFILGMFFGLKGGRGSKDNFDVPLRRYFPLSGGSYGGAMEYRLDYGDLIRIERDFDKNVTKVFGSTFNDITHTFEISREKGVLFAQKHIGVDEVCFERTVFIKQIRSEGYNEENKEVADKLTNLNQTGYEDISYVKANATLKEALVKYVGTGKTKNRPLETASYKLRQLTIKREDLLKEREERAILESEIRECQNVEERLRSEEQFLKKAEEIIGFRKIIAEKTCLREDLSRVLEDIKAMHNELSYERNSIMNNTKIPTLGASISLILSIFAFLFVTKNQLNGGIILGVILIFISGLLFYIERKVQKSYKKNKNEFSDKKEELLKTINKISLEISSSENAIESELKFIRTLKLPEERADLLIDRLFMGSVKEVDFFLKEEKKIVLESFDQNKMKMMNFQTLINNLSDDDEIQRIEEEMAEVQETIINISDMGKSLRIAMEVLDESSRELGKNFSHWMNLKISEIVNEISEGRYKDIRADSDLVLKVLEPICSKVIPVSMLSFGTMEQMYFAQRIAMADMLIKETKERLPFILDEVFSQYDDHRTKRMFEYFYKHFNDRQILFFSCKLRELEIAREVFGERLNIVTLK